MTDIPAVVYLKAEQPYDFNKEGDLQDENLGRKQHVKKHKTEKRAFAAEKGHNTLKKLLIEFDREMIQRLDAIEDRVDFLTQNFSILEQKVETISSFVERQNSDLRSRVICRNMCDNISGSAVPVSSRENFIILNSEEDYPNGSWLGEERNHNLRVRCHISPTDLFHINTTCTSAEKMALTLLDHLFDRETQACSNISGMGKHKKKQLDPLYIYGIKCHLIHHFDITDQDWDKIKQNIDSKCRSAFRRKNKGLPLKRKIPQTVSFVRRENGTFCNLTNPSSRDSSTNMSVDQDLTLQAIEASADEKMLEKVMQDEKVSQHKQRPFQIFHATAEQIVELQQSHQIQILDGSEILASSVKLPAGSSLIDNSECSNEKELDN